MSAEELRGVPFCRPDVTEEEIQEVVRAIRSGWITTGPKVREFEEAFARRIGAPWAVAVSSCTAGLHLSLAALGCGPGDEVITSTNTFTATAASIVQTGARPVLVDIEEDTFNIDPARVEEAITDRTRAIVPVHIAGHPAEMDRILESAASRRIPVIEDAAHSLPAAFRGRTIGTLSDLTCFSFYATKNLTTGEGGMITGAGEELHEKVALLGYHGMSRDGWKRYTSQGSWAYDILAHGFKYNLSDIAASMGLGQLARLDGMQERRRAIVARYDEAFASLDPVIRPVARPHVEHAWHLYVIRIRPEALTIDRDELIRRLAERKIGTSVHFIPLHRHTYYRESLGLSAGSFPVAERVFSTCVSLPLFPSMTGEEVDRVIGAVREIIGESIR
ncbi:MAG TPA: DegT/DnrJ/EryC1/StrS family aminotransferase [Candidatus Saccharimonadales bacterium]|nr:DegT/DnrJ/EryC1/StrS family aminotransferase [Candidatus Saccharimonadales bacterium]